MNSNSFQRPSLFWPFIFSLICVHLPLIWFLFFFSSSSFTSYESVMSKEVQEPIMFDLKTLPLVDLDQPLVEEIPKNPSAVGQYSVSVSEETVNQPVAPVYAPQKNSPPLTRPSRAQEQKGDVPKKENPQPLPNSTDQPSLKSVLGQINEKSKKEETELSQLVNESASEENFKTSFEAKGDYLPFYKVGNKTFVNAMAYPHVGYYVAMKRKFRIAWNPNSAVRGIHHLLPPNQIQTVWGITLDDQGRILSLTLIEGSHVSVYDQEAKRAILASQPFAPPPKELLNTDNELDVAWGFIMYNY